MLGHADGMVLHPGTSPNVSQDENLYVLILGLRSRAISNGFQPFEGLGQPGERFEAIAKPNDENNAREHGQEECGNHARPIELVLQEGV